MAACLLAVVVACALGAVGAWRGAIALPWFEQSFGAFQVVGYSTWNAECRPYEGCAPTRHEAYVIWVAWRSAARGQGAERLLWLPIER